MDEQGVVLQCLSRTNSYFQNTEYAARNYPDAAELVYSTNEKRSTARSLHANLPAAGIKGDGKLR